MEVSGKLLYRMDVGPDGGGRVVAALELIEHQLTKMGHRGILLVTQTLNSAAAHTTNTAVSAAPAA